MTDKIRWGILGTGTVAHEFAAALETLPDAELVAVGSRHQETADVFGDKFGIPRRHPNYGAVGADSGVDIVYIATPHTFHHRDATMALEAGKHVLVEKAFTINASEAREIIDLAHRKSLFAMEAMWTRFFPIMIRLRELLADNAIGDVQMLRADLSHRVEFDPAHRLYDPHQGGGALLDVGVYPISFASMVLGKPNSVIGVAHLGQSGVDDRSACLLGYRTGAMAVLSFSQTTDAPREALISGTEGVIKIHGRWQQPAQMTLQTGGKNGPQELIDLPFEGSGYQYQATAVMDCIRSGQTGSDIMPLSESLSIMQTMDQLRSQWGLVYPGE
jgi:predicted dehydrogenase